MLNRIILYKYLLITLILIHICIMMNKYIKYLTL